LIIFIEETQKMKLYGMLRAFNQSMETEMMDEFTADELFAE
jgi:hypothetical protein